MYSPAGQKLDAYLFASSDGYAKVTPFLLQVTLTSATHILAPVGWRSGPAGIGVGTFFPWGEAKGGYNPQDTWNFGTYWHDSASGLDYANNRYYSNAYGRFMTPDPYRASGGPSDPGSWNRYAYVGSDPINRADPRGSYWCTVGNGEYSQTTWCEDFSIPVAIASSPQAGIPPVPANAILLAQEAVKGVADTTMEARLNAKNAVQGLGQGCTNVFNDPTRNINGMTLDQALLANAGTATYANTFGVQGNLTLSQIGVVDPASGRAYQGDPTLSTYNSPAAYAETFGNQAILLNPFYYLESDSDKSVTLVHELLHHTFGGASDSAVDDRFGIHYAIGQNDAETQRNAGLALSDWLRKDCPLVP